MPPKQLPSDFPIHTFPTAIDFEAFLDREHLTAPGCYIKLAKKASGIPSITAPEAVRVCLCFGWIDGKAGAVDDKWWLGRYTPRRSKSLWSKINTETVARLTQEGKMRPAGLAAVEAAKADGRWDRAYDRPTGITVPDDLARALEGVPAAGAFFGSLNKTDRYFVIHRIQTTPLKARTTTLGAIVGMLARGNLPMKRAKPQSKLKKDVVVKKTVNRRTTEGVKKTPIEKTAARQRPAKRDISGTTIRPTVEISEPRRPGLRPRG